MIIVWWSGGNTVIIRQNSVQLQLQLPTGTELGNIEIELSESTDELLQVFTIRGKSKKLKDIAAYNVAQCLSCNSDVEDLQVPISLKKLVKPFVITFSGNYIFDLNEI